MDAHLIICLIDVLREMNIVLLIQYDNQKLVSLIPRAST